MVRGKSREIKYYQSGMDALDSPDGSADHRYAVWCIETDDDAGGANDHRHVVAVRTKGAGERVRRWTVVHVIAAFRDGALFVVGKGGGQPTVLEPAICPSCRCATLVTHPAAELSELPACP